MTVANSQAWHVLPISKREDGYFLPVRTKPATWQKAKGVRPALDHHRSS